MAQISYENVEFKLYKWRGDRAKWLNSETADPVPKGGERRCSDLKGYFITVAFQIKIH